MVTPYITFNGHCNEALAFYQDVFGSQIKELRHYEEYMPVGVETPPENLSTWVLHAEMLICGSNFWFADEIHPLVTGNMIKLTATVPNAQTGWNYFEKLQENGCVSLPPIETFYSTFHASLTDKFGVSWNIVAEEPPQK